jgi:hypothetical protein
MYCEKGNVEKLIPRISTVRISMTERPGNNRRKRAQKKELGEGLRSQLKKMRYPEITKKRFTAYQLRARPVK